MEEDEGTTPRRPRRRAVRPAGPTSNEPAGQVAVKSRPVEPAVVEEPHETPDTPSGEGSTVDAPRRRTSVVLTSLFVVVVLALLAAGIFLFLGNRSSAADDARAEKFVQTARQTVLNLTTIHPDSAQADVDRLLAGASGDFKAEFEGREGPFVEVVQQARVDSNGEIIEAGIESSSDTSADVLVAARAMVQNSDAAQAAPRDFRLRITVTDDNGVMTASRVEFVP